ncbi:hypothetical protein M201_gp24 [Haloarcula californiae tailed virus 2]|uniref:Uncharacterized protein n=1 Tax=Haloarcula californiae tailed virus 2 TaxID=1273747 RepID=R4TNJ8_9CAUD|nr:hypothetical protein M201_gp24 [Haloarcula californiae tailed virus 2]AGM11798.1 hypothetical protein HCTV2_24 [Haloarcula californiae tailed virus 2]
MADDYLLPWFPGGGLTYDEWHAALLGLAGVLAGAAAWGGEWGGAISLSVLLVSFAWGLRAMPESQNRLAARVVRREPWYFTGVYVASAVAAYAALVVVA